MDVQSFFLCLRMQQRSPAALVLQGHVRVRQG
eukprot:CAMPEP_0204364780 /NCGR_PEP_ID=MMETSP0469-20131031/41410_1 /ASSEMBLY_ACC=CAM_ASM_000384 /TAXON_ID=2969 /ORGANISM="Oxyrrhis marina" /LENGTH=31 /DNA_ID= /DNA_START= /DNA_END= /DNA_ORIENTATION=